MDISFYEEKINQASGQINLLNDDLKKKKIEAKRLDKYKKDLEKAQVFLQGIAKKTQEQLRFHITDIVQLALDTCFPGRYTFDVNFEIKRGKTEAQLVFVSEGEETDIMEAAGGGLVDLSAFALRIVAWSLGSTDDVIILDEPFKHLSEDLQPLSADVLSAMSKELGLQLIIITHRPEITNIADKIFEVKLKYDEKIKYMVSEVSER